VEMVDEATARATDTCSLRIRFSSRLGACRSPARCNVSRCVGSRDCVPLFIRQWGRIRWLEDANDRVGEEDESEQGQRERGTNAYRARVHCMLVVHALAGGVELDDLDAHFAGLDWFRVV
jgi:hypothetical protein